VRNRGDGNVLRFDGATGAFIDAFVTNGSGGLGEPGAILFTPSAPHLERFFP
jgi:hypothetical protein